MRIYPSSIVAQIIMCTLLLTQCSAGFAALTPDQVVANIKIITGVSSDATAALGSLSPSTTPADVATSGEKLITDFRNIIQSLTADVTAMNTTPAFTDDAAGLVVNALTDFVKVHQLLLSTVIGKHTIFAQFFLTAPVAAVLRALEAEVDVLAFSLIALIPTRTSNVQDSQKSLDESLGDAISKYQEICIPSPLYPAINPICVALSL